MKKVKFVCYIQKRYGEISEIDKNDKTHPEGWAERRIIMFWNNLVTLCNKNNTSPTAVANVLGIAIGSITKWKNGSVPRDTTLKKIADYFGVTAEELLCDSVASTDSTKQDLYNLFEGLSPEQQEQLKLYAKFLRDQK